MSKSVMSGLGVLVVALSFVSVVSQAADISWTNTVGGDFSAVGNWSPSQVPGLADTALIDNDSATAYEITFSQDVTNSYLKVLEDKVRLNLSGGSYALNTKLLIGSSSGLSELTLTGGVVSVYNGVSVGYEAGGAGNLTVSGTNTVLDMQNTWYLSVGDNGTGSVQVTDGAVVKNVQYLGVGRFQSTGPGVLLIDNAIATNVGSVIVGQGGQGTVVVTNGGSLNLMSSSWSIQGYDSRVTVDGAGSLIYSAGYLMGGTVSGGMTLIVTNGGNMSVSALYHAYGSSGMTGRLVVAGANSVFSTRAGKFMIGGHASAAKGGTGLVDINDGGVLYCGEVYAWSNSVITLNGGQLDATGKTLRLNEASLLRGTGIVKCASALNSGTVVPGLPTGTLVVTNGNYTQAGALEIKLGGVNAGQYSKLVVDGTMTLGGTCTVSLVDGYDPEGQTTYDILDWTTLSGTFDTLNLISPPNTLWITNDLYTTGEITYVGPPRGTVVLVR